MDPETARTLIGGLIAAGAGLGGTSLGWGLSARSENKQLAEARLRLQREAEVARVVGMVRIVRSVSSNARDLGHALYLRQGGRVNVSGFSEARDQLNEAIADMDLAISECEVLGPDWIAQELEEFRQTLQQEYLPTAMTLVERFLADDVRAIQDQIAALDATQKRFVNTAANHVRGDRVAKTVD